MEQKQTKPVQAISVFKNPLSVLQIYAVISDALKVCNEQFVQDFSKQFFLKRWFSSPDLYFVDNTYKYYYSYDGVSPMRLGKGNVLDPEFYPDAKYETRYQLSIYGSRSMYLFFDVIPGIAKEGQFGTEIKENELVDMITIKANFKSNAYWQSQQSKFLKFFLPILEQTDLNCNCKNNLEESIVWYSLFC